MEILFDYRLRVTALLLMTLLLVACNTDVESTPSATSSQDTSAQITALTPSASPANSASPRIPLALRLNAATPEQVQAAFAAVNFVSFDDEPREDGTPHIVGYHDTDEIAVGITGEDRVERVQVADFSGGLQGIEEFDFLIQLFAPSAKEWLAENIDTALANPAIDHEAQRTFGDTNVVFAALNTDEGRQMRVYIEPAE